jgi:protein-S-isoprenylcysteine O-methyltransferase Ste14
MNRVLTISYGLAGSAVFLVAFLYAVGFVGDILVPRSIEAGVTAPLGEAVIVNVLLLGFVRCAAQRHGAAGVQTVVDAIRAQDHRAQHLRSAVECVAVSAVLARCCQDLWIRVV